MLVPVLSFSDRAMSNRTRDVSSDRYYQTHRLSLSCLKPVTNGGLAGVFCRSWKASINMTPHTKAPSVVKKIAKPTNRRSLFKYNSGSLRITLCKRQMPGSMKMNIADSDPIKLMTGEMSGTRMAMTNDKANQTNVTSTRMSIRSRLMSKIPRSASRPQYSTIG